MDILFLADNFPPEKNAQASRVFERAVYWVRWGHAVTVLTCAPNFPEGRVYPGYANRWYQVEEMAGIRVVRVKTFISANSGTFRRTLDFLSFMGSAFLAGVLQRRPDVVVSTSPQFFAAIAGWALAKCRRRPFVLEVSDLWPESIVAVGAMKRSFAIRLLEKIELGLYRSAARVVLLTNSFRDNLLRRGIAGEKLDVVLNGADLKRYQPMARDPGLAAQLGVDGRLVVGYIGTFGMAHALENVLEAAALVRDPDVRFMLVGPGADRESLIDRASRMNLTNVVFVPAQPKDAIPTYWSLCDIALVHLRNTPLFATVIPSKIFEAMAMGIPTLVAAPKGEAAELVETEGSGLWVRAEDPQSLARAVMLLKQDFTLRSELAANCRTAALRHTREKQAHEMLVCLDRAVVRDKTDHGGVYSSSLRSSNVAE